MTFNDEKSIFLGSKEASTTSAVETGGLRSQPQQQEEADTWIFPSIQMGPFDVRHDSDLTERFLQSGAEGSRFKFATGYFNLTNEYKNVMLHSSKGIS